MTDRAVREFAVYVEGRLALVVSDEPGTLRSTAGPPAGGGGPPPPPGPPPGPGEPMTTERPPGGHPFLDAQAYDAVSEDRLRRLLLESASFDEYLERLIGAGFDIASCRPLEGYDHELPGGVRLAGGDGPAGVCWPAPGQFTTLARQPAERRAGVRRRDRDGVRPRVGRADARGAAGRELVRGPPRAAARRRPHSLTSPSDRAHSIVRRNVSSTGV